MINAFAKPFPAVQSKEHAEAFERFSIACQEQFGHRICTVFAWSSGDVNCVRVWSNHPSAYPFPAQKLMGPTEWGKAVLYQQEPWEALTVADVKEAFFDFAVISSFDCGCCLSAPVLRDGIVVGAVSILDVEGQYNKGDAKRFSRLASTLACELPTSATEKPGSI